MICEKKQTIYDKRGSDVLILLCWLVYAISYFGKVNYSANITGIMDFYNITRAQAGIAPTFFFFAYGIGQVVNGLFCKKYNMKWMVFASLTVSASINFVIAVSSNFAIVKWLWMVNGFALSVLWPSLIRLLSESLPQKALARSSLVMGTTVASGTLIIYGLSSAYAALGNFKLAFYTAAFTGLAISVLWVFSYKNTVRAAENERIEENSTEECASDITEKRKQSKDRKMLFYISVAVLCFCAIGVNLIKDGLTTWLPVILKDEYSVSDSISILLTVFLPVVAIFGNMFAMGLHKKIPDFITHCAIVFAAMLTFIVIIIGGLTLKIILIMLIALIVVSFLASSLNNLITIIFPIFMRENVNSGLCAGILNGFCYLGSTISSYGLGVIADNFGWKMLFWFLAGFCATVCFICCAYIVFKRIFITRFLEKNIN